MGLVEKTKQLETSIRDLFGTSISLINKSEEQGINETLLCKTIIAVIGEKNCGKSSLINEMLGLQVVPVADTTCTSRIIWIKYASSPYMSLQDPKGKEIPGSRKPLSGLDFWKNDADKRRLKELAILKQEDRDNAALVFQTVVIGLNHELLRHGIEFIDSPGRNENNMLNKVVDDVVLKKVLPILIYVIDGKMALRPGDRASIQYYKDRCPRTKLFYVCNKVDVDEKAAAMDSDSDSDSDENDLVNRPELIKTKVRDQLKEHQILDDYSLTPKYHGLAMKKVKEARTKCKHAELRNFVEDFESFKVNLARSLDYHLKEQLSIAVCAMMRCHGRCFYCISQKQEILQKEEDEMTRVLGDAQTAELDLYNRLASFVEAKRGKIREIIKNEIDNAKQDAMKKAPKLALDKITAYELFLLHPDVTERYPNGVPSGGNFSQMHTLCHELRNIIVNNVSRNVEVRVDDLLENEICRDVLPKVVETMEALDNPTLKRNLESIYQFVGNDNDYKEATGSSLTNLVYALVTVARENLRFELQHTYSLLAIIEIALQENRKNPRGSPARTAVVNTLISQLDANRLADSVVDACKKKMESYHTTFETSMKQIEFFKEEIQIQSREHLGASASRVLSMLAQLEIENHGIKFEVTRGELKRGKLLYRGQNCTLHLCDKSWSFINETQYIMRVIQRISDESWMESITSLYYAYNCKRSSHLIGIYGWTMTNSDVLQVVTERAATSLDKANSGLSTHQKLSVMRDVVCGLDAIHSSGFIYNNLAPKQVLLMDDNQAKLNICSGNFEVLRGQGPNLDIDKIAELMLWMFGLQVPATAVSSVGLIRPAGCSEDVWKLIRRCLPSRKDITIKGIIGELNILLN
uniref:Dual serine/threonine and tyrosine protein kinase-like n=1 Tax=Saccoglossus kowalevskii TaxID=10224 RepID=A0ABM0GX85_SACKO|nr:PREDICTED: dual serine/threonine and tyrosine protein kinase-like [Saccoglossus kowalevskii]